MMFEYMDEIKSLFLCESIDSNCIRWFCVDNGNMFYCWFVYVDFDV